jgi:hypothetical protein
MVHRSTSWYNPKSNSQGGSAVLVIIGVVIGAGVLYEYGLGILAGLSKLGIGALVVLSGGVKVAFLELAHLTASGTWLSELAWQQIAANVAGGIVVDIVIGLVRLGRRKRNARTFRLLEDLADSVSNPTAVTAAGISRTCLALHVLVSVLVSLGIGALGVTAPANWVGVAYGARPFSYAIGIVGGPGPGGAGWGGSPGGWMGFLMLALAFILLAVSLSLVVGFITHAAAAWIGGTSVSLSATAAGAIAGGQAATGRVAGAALVIALTRLWTGRLVRNRMEAPNFELHLWSYIYQTRGKGGPHYYDALIGFEKWCQTNHREVNPSTYKACVQDYMKVVVVDKQGRYGVSDRLEGFLYEFQRETDKFLEHRKSLFSDGAPPLTREKNSLLYPGWVRRALITGVSTGVVSGAVYALIVPTIAFFLGSH